MHLNGHHLDVSRGAPRSIARSACDPQPAPGRPDWSIVVITRNEEEQVGACLASVFQAFAGRSFEVVLVDSASTDRTVEIASRFPVTIIGLAPSPRLSPAVGRYFGFARTVGSFVLFLDGDCVLDPQWVPLAEHELREDPGLAGVAGASYGRMPRNVDSTEGLQDEYPRADYDNPAYLAGSAAYKREVLLRTGGFNPYLYACEEEELGARVRKAGYRMRRLRARMSQHHPRNAKETCRELLRRLRRRYFVGLGQLVRHALVHELPIERPAGAIRRHLAYFALLAAGLCAAIASAILATPAPALAWLGLMIGIFVLFAVRARGLRKPVYYFLEWTLASPLVVYGIFLAPRSPESPRADLRPAIVLTAGQSEVRP